MLKSLFKPLSMLLRNAIMWIVLSFWLFKGVKGAGNVFAFYAVGVAILTLIYTFMPMKPEKVAHVRLLGTFWRCVELASQWAMLVVLVWFGHTAIAIAWGIACSCLAVVRIRIQVERKKALKAQAEAIMKSFMAMAAQQKQPPAQPA